MMSDKPPAGYGTISDTGLFGKVCAATEAATAKLATTVLQVRSKWVRLNRMAGS